MSETSPPVRLALAGCGNHAITNLLPAFRLAETEIVAACDLWESRRDLAARLGIPRLYQSIDEMLDAVEVDGVVVCGPPAMHQAVGGQVIERGLALFVEKPPAPDLGKMGALRDLAAEKKSVAMAAFMKRFAQKYQQLRAIAAGADEGIHHLLVRYSHGMQAQGEDARDLVMIMMVIHAIDLVRALMGSPKRVQFTCGGPGESSINLCAQFTFANDATATLISDNTLPYAVERVEATLQDEFVVVDEVAHLRHYQPSSSPWTPTVWEQHSPNFPLQVAANITSELQGYAGEARAFVEAIRTGEVREATLDDAYEAMRLCRLFATEDDGDYVLEEE